MNKFILLTALTFLPLSFQTQAQNCGNQKACGNTCIPTADQCSVNTHKIIKNKGSNQQKHAESNINRGTSQKNIKQAEVNKKAQQAIPNKNTKQAQNNKYKQQVTAKQKPTTKSGQYIIIAKSLNVRALPRQDSRILGKLRKGNVVSIVTQTSPTPNWKPIKFGKSYGWISARYIRAVR